MASIAARAEARVDAYPGDVSTSTLNDIERCEPSAVAQHTTINTGTFAEQTTELSPQSRV